MVEDMIVFAEHGEEAKSDAVTLLYVSDGEAEISFPGSLPDGGMKEGSLVPGDLLFLAPGIEYTLQASGQVISISLTSPPPLPEDLSGGTGPPAFPPGDHSEHARAGLLSYTPKVYGGNGSLSERANSEGAREGCALVWFRGGVSFNKLKQEQYCIFV